MPKREDEFEYEYEDPDGGSVRYRIYIERHRGGRDEIVVHTYERTDIAAMNDKHEDHELWRFWIIDEEEHECKYHTTRNKAEPSDLALIGLQEYGWDCLNFDITPNEELERGRREAFAELAGLLESTYRGETEDPVFQAVIKRMWLEVKVWEVFMHIAQQGNGNATATLAGKGDREELSLNVDVPTSGTIPATREDADYIMERVEEIVTTTLPDAGYEFDDNRNFSMRFKE